MRKRIIRTYIAVMGVSLVVSLLLSLTLIWQYYDRGKAFLVQTVLLTFLFCILIGIWVAYLIGSSISKSYTLSIQSIMERARDITVSAAKYSAMIDASTRWEGLDIQPIVNNGNADPDDELKSLDQTFRSMSGYLQQVNMVLLRGNAQLQAVLQNMQEGVISFDNDGNIQLLTERSTSFLGEAQKQKQRLALLGQNYARLDHLIEQKRATELPFAMEMETTYPEERILGVYVTTLQGTKDLPSNNAGMLIVLQDLTRIKQLETMRKEFVANVTHELKTPLTSICGYIELLQSSERDAETRRAFYEIISIEADRLMSLIQDLLTLSELEQRPGMLVPKESCELKPVVDALLAKLKPLADEKQVLLHCEIPPGFVVPGRAEKQHQIFSNLISNSIVYNNPGGYVRVSAFLERDRLVCRVEDNGIGIAKQDQERIFERFYRVHKERSRFLGGTGLGLSIVKHMVQMLGGTIRLDSEFGEGSSFTILYPLMEDERV